jgi:hypothetical protein
MDTPNTEHNIEFEMNGKNYTAQVEVEWKYVDDSFDGHAYGRPHTFEAHHWEPEDWEIIWIEDEDGNSVDETPALTKFIASEVDDLEYND